MRKMPLRVEDRGYETPCHIYTGYLSERGYAQCGNGRVYRVMWEAEHGPVPEGLELDHLCRQRDCVNLNHLEPVTHQENMRRSSVARAAAAAQTESGIRALRARLDMSQRELAAALGVSRALVGLWEVGKHPVREPHLARLLALAST
jgi:DNA-binding transcriptional regulator YiaG